MQQAMILSAWTMQVGYANGIGSKGRKGSGGAQGSGLGPGLGQGMEFTTGRDKRHLAGSGPSIINHSHTTIGSPTHSACIIPFYDLLRTVALSCQPHKTFYVPKTVARDDTFAGGSVNGSPELAQGQGLGQGLGQGGPGQGGLGQGSGLGTIQGDHDACSISTHSHSSLRSGDIMGEGEGEEGMRYAPEGSRVRSLMEGGRDEVYPLVSRKVDRRTGIDYGISEVTYRQNHVIIVTNTIMSSSFLLTFVYLSSHLHH